MLLGTPFLRACAVLLALVANLVATAVPVLHALAHEVDERDHPTSELQGASQVDHTHDEVHPGELHDERVLIKRQVLDLAFILPPETELPESISSPAKIQHRLALPLTSRAPPSADLARAPPLT